MMIPMNKPNPVPMSSKVKPALPPLKSVPIKANPAAGKPTTMSMTNGVTMSPVTLGPVNVVIVVVDEARAVYTVWVTAETVVARKSTGQVFCKAYKYQVVKVGENPHISM